jgi:hypothetical protein
VTLDVPHSSSETSTGPAHAPALPGRAARDPPRRKAMKRTIGVLVALMVVLGAARSEAGITDPVPAGFKYVYTVPGVINNGAVGTAFICTATDNVTVGVEVFDAAGAAQNSVGAGITLAGGQSVTLVTQILPNLVGYSNLGIFTSFQGSARIVGSSNKMVCTALLMDTSGNLISSLPILKKDKQKGQ